MCDSSLFHSCVRDLEETDLSSLNGCTFKVLFMLMQHDYTAKSVLQRRWLPSRESLTDESSTTCCFLDEADDWTMVTGDSPCLASPRLHPPRTNCHRPVKLTYVMSISLPAAHHVPRVPSGATLSHTLIHPCLRRYGSKHLHVQLWMYGTKMAQGTLRPSTIPRQARLISRVCWVAFFFFLNLKCLCLWWLKSLQHYRLRAVKHLSFGLVLSL